ncbi:MAG: hypothetical protein EZS28_031937 [Streblomastix strix]|uniref:Uncharacterized protein n=1 Tax=Streblomastix strix TaxID=222440 RepID=A0A5J4UP95_9EUKA|nr:MAG: hypothetical protein EZS28_031937 [Streblomastix strix]
MKEKQVNEEPNKLLQNPIPHRNTEQQEEETNSNQLQQETPSPAFTPLPEPSPNPMIASLINWPSLAQSPSIQSAPIINLNQQIQGLIPSPGSFMALLNDANKTSFDDRKKRADQIQHLLTFVHKPDKVHQMVSAQNDTFCGDTVDIFK